MKQWLPILLIGWLLGMLSAVSAPTAIGAPQAAQPSPQQLSLSADASTIYLFDAAQGLIYRYNTAGRLVESFRIAALGETLVRQ